MSNKKTLIKLKRNAMTASSFLLMKQEVSHDSPLKLIDIKSQEWMIEGYLMTYEDIIETIAITLSYDYLQTEPWLIVTGIQ